MYGCQLFCLSHFCLLRSFNFISTILFKHKVAFKVNNDELAFYLRFDDLWLVLIWPSRLTGFGWLPKKSKTPSHLSVDWVLNIRNQTVNWSGTNGTTVMQGRLLETSNQNLILCEFLSFLCACVLIFKCLHFLCVCMLVSNGCKPYDSVYAYCLSSNFF